MAGDTPKAQAEAEEENSDVALIAVNSEFSTRAVLIRLDALRAASLGEGMPTLQFRAMAAPTAGHGGKALRVILEWWDARKNRSAPRGSLRKLPGQTESRRIAATVWRGRRAQEI